MCVACTDEDNELRQLQSRLQAPGGRGRALWNSMSLLEGKYLPYDPCCFDEQGAGQAAPSDRQPANAASTCNGQAQPGTGSVPPPQPTPGGVAGGAETSGVADLRQQVADLSTRVQELENVVQTLASQVDSMRPPPPASDALVEQLRDDRQLRVPR